ncbi:MAG: hypothetical protein A2931_00285 [Candidatus Niyogibacteria bacterium RIFCSPLOWO2_01_FULL_45_48]|uniref:Transglycosylase SLT domain-containing protein n=2 Tax=Candidatus Niyogiibacteriota TaxID=1817912 RepID=A0A1G2EZ87_9BACT|nr:MAG: hypothetical protein A2931_00285 [Candidatus Niyogibacteria bacterium RIFCSPLOWO2_01_FULL_45_48]OGZ31109.1 MAG: hypothetical protein A3J00_03260 [Candidatus Niyogibacteria bacterium RIFCSPLOWO2_02_FULL_45_13]
MPFSCELPAIKNRVRFSRDSLNGADMAKRIVLGAFFLIFTVFYAQFARGQTEFCGNINISHSFVGGFKKALRFERRILELANLYGLDPNMILAIMLYESGGNENLVSSAGALGLMQVMPLTARDIKNKHGITDNLEAGIRYLKDLSRVFGGDTSLIIAAYNGGPGRISRGEFRLETVQYLMGVSSYYHILAGYKSCLRKAVADLKLSFLPVDSANNSWEAVSLATGIPVLELRMFNPFLAHRVLKPGMVIVYPEKPIGVKPGLVYLPAGEKTAVWYKIRLGDIYHHLANIFGLSYGEFRRMNHLLYYSGVNYGTLVEITGALHVK